jgi:ABC-2 type transport system permease protein
VLLGKLLADGIRMGIQALLILTIAFVLTLVAGWRIPFATNVVGVVMIAVLAALFGVAFSGLSNTVALRTKSTEATMMASFSLTFPLLFMSTAMLPKALLPGWVQSVSTFNPVSYLADAARALIISGYDWTLIGKALVAIAIVGAILNGMAISAFRAQGK